MQMLQEAGIELLADIRSYPGSRWCPQFNEKALQLSLAENAIDYLHMPGLGGRRKLKDAAATKHGTFDRYLEHMQSAEFLNAIEELESRALKKPTAYMCAEADWRKCHRSLVSDHLFGRGWKIIHLLKPGESEAHHLRD
jgi:uncharacterized protein (DUF488 family)